MPWLRPPSNGTSSSGLHGQQMSRWFFTFFCKYSKNRSASSFSLLFTLFSHAITFDLSLSTKEDFNTFFFQLQSQLPARAQVWTVVRGGKEAGAGRFVLLSPQRCSKLLHFPFYLMSHLNAFKVVALFASDGSNLIGKAQVERIQDEFCLLLYRCCLFRSLTYCGFPQGNEQKYSIAKLYKSQVVPLIHRTVQCSTLRYD